MKDGYEIEVADEAKNNELFALNQKKFMNKQSRLDYATTVLKVGASHLTSIL